jgi:hypothetical protein
LIRSLIPAGEIETLQALCGDSRTDLSRVHHTTLTAAPNWSTLEATAGNVLHLELGIFRLTMLKRSSPQELLWRSRRWKSNTSIGSPLNIKIHAPTDHFRYNATILSVVAPAFRRLPKPCQGPRRQAIPSFGAAAASHRYRNRLSERRSRCGKSKVTGRDACSDAVKVKVGAGGRSGCLSMLDRQLASTVLSARVATTIGTEPRPFSRRRYDR